MKNLLGAIACLAAAGLLATIATRLPTDRVYNLDLGNPAIRDTYLIPHRTEAERCFVVDRRDATIRRSDDNQPGRKWQCYELAREGESQASWMVQSKRKGKGTVFLVPADDVADWSYPFFYGFVRKLRPELDLPEIEWTQLFINRLYEGLYLRVELPFDARKKDGGSGVLREILTIEGERLAVVNTRFEEVRGLFNEAIALAKPPVVAAQPDSLVWLQLRLDADAITYLMSSQAPYDLRLLPIPISLPELYQTKTGHPPVQFEDARYRAWASAWRPQTPPDPFDADERARLEVEYAAYREGLVLALRADGKRTDSLARHTVELASRQDAARQLGLPLAEAL